MAGGTGTRFGSEIPKQFALLDNKPVLMHTLETFFHLEDTAFILVLPEHWHSHWADLCKKFNFNLPHTVIEGGSTRFQSVAAGLKHVKNPSLVIIHDAVRPLVTPELINTCVKYAQAKSCAIPVIPLTDTLRFVSGPHNKAVDRNQYRSVQTPQVFKSNLILQAYQQGYDEKFTDDASVLGALGYPVILVPGEVENIKITTPIDLQIAELVIQNRK